MATIPTAAALDLMYRSSTTGAPTAEFDRLGGYAAVKAAAEAAGYGATPEFIQSYEIANNIPESAYTKLNKQFIGSEGAAKMAQLEADLNSQNAALVAQTRANLAAQSAAADQQAAAEAAQRAAAANTGGGGRAPTSDELRQMAQDSVTLRYLNEDLYTKTGKTYDTIAEAQAAQRAAAANSGGGPAGSPWSSITQEELTQMMRDSNNQRLAEEQAREQQSMARQRAEEEAFYAARAAQQASIAPQAVAQQAVAQQAAIQQVAAQQAALQRAAQARSVGLLDAAPAPRAAAPAINRPTGISQPSYTQVAPAQITNRAITGTPYSSIYSPATMQQNMPSLANIQAAARSANPYAALMALTPQRTLSPAYSTQANSYLGGFNPNIYNPATTPVTGLLNTTGLGNDGAGGNDGLSSSPPGGGYGIPGATMVDGISGKTTGLASIANSVAAYLGNLNAGKGISGSISDYLAKNIDPSFSHEGRTGRGTGSTTVTNSDGKQVTVDKSSLGSFTIGPDGLTSLGGVNVATGLQGQGSTGQTGLYGDAAAGFRAAELAERNAFTAAITGLLGGGGVDPQTGLQGQGSTGQTGLYGDAGNQGGYGGGSDAPGANADGYGGGDAGFGGGSQAFAKGGMVNMNPQMRNPPGPDDGYAALDNGEYVIRKKAVKKYGSNIFEQINAGRIPAQRLKSLLE